ncbi:hypothetical protein H8356DRAFT_1723577 [Neocallimastix lanati (nom. inval.)]|nr:hypothetical protein H8356DRAFT_1723577 [Neocallimastix sp. JGI-2020a]
MISFFVSFILLFERVYTFFSISSFSFKTYFFIYICLWRLVVLGIILNIKIINLKAY